MVRFFLYQVVGSRSRFTDVSSPKNRIFAFPINKNFP